MPKKKTISKMRLNVDVSDLMYEEFQKLVEEKGTTVSKRIRMLITRDLLGHIDDTLVVRDFDGSYELPDRPKTKIKGWTLTEFHAYWGEVFRREAAKMDAMLEAIEQEGGFGEE